MDNIGKFKQYSDTLLSAKGEDNLSEVKKELGKLILTQPWLLYEVPQEQRELFVQKLSQNEGSDLKFATKVQGVANTVFVAPREVVSMEKAHALADGVFRSTLSANELQVAYKDPFSFLGKESLRRRAGEKIVIEIAKIAAAQDGRGVSENIRNYEITAPAALIEIAKIAAAKSGRGVSEYIRNYGITDQAALIEIAKIAAAENGYGVSKEIVPFLVETPVAPTVG